MKASTGLFNILKPMEGFRSAPYIDPVGIPTIGYGSTKYPSGRKVAMTDMAITEYEASVLVLDTLGEYEAAVNRLVKVNINQNQFDVLVDFAYNLGAGALGGSTLLRKLNSGDYAGASNELLNWDKGRVRGNLVVLPGLVKRCALRKQLFDKE